MDNIEKFKQIVSEMADTYEKKNADYGNSFETTLDKWGVNIGLARIEDKFNRITSLLSSSDQKVKDESIEDTLKDMATYTIMLLMWLQKPKCSGRVVLSNSITDVSKFSFGGDNNCVAVTNEVATIGFNLDHLLTLKHWKLKGGIDSKGFPTKTMYADVERYEVIGDNIKIYFNNVRNTRGQLVGSGTFVSTYPLNKLEEYGLR